MTDQRTFTRPATAAWEGFDLVQSSPDRARTLLLGACAGPQPVDRLVGRWGLGRLELDNGQIDNALIHYQEALALVPDTPPALAAEMRISLALTLQAGGNRTAALEQLELAEPYVDGGTLGRLWMQRGTIASLEGDRPAAIGAYDVALPLLLDAGDELAAARLRSNRGVAEIDLGQLDDARHDLALAAATAHRLGQHLLAAGAVHNAAYLDGRTGKVPEALSGFAAARDAYLRVGSPGRYLGDVDIDEAAVLLEAGLGSEAATVGQRVIDAARRNGNRNQLGDAMLTVARARLIDGDAVAARDLAADAVTIFDAAGRPAWAALARYWQVVIAEQIDSDSVGSTSPVELVVLATELTRNGWPAQAAEVRVRAVRAAVATGDHHLAAQLLASTADARRSELPRVRAGAWHAAAIVRGARGDHAGASRALRLGLDAVDHYRSSLVSGELRAAAGTLGADLAVQGVRLSLAAKAPRRVLAWAERWRAGAFGSPGGVTVAAALLSELRQARLAALADPDEGARRRLAELERAVSTAARARRSTPGGSAGPLSPAGHRQRVEQAIDALGDRVAVEYLHIDGQLRAVVVAGGRATLHHIGALDEVRRAAQHLESATRRMSASADERITARAREAFEVARHEVDRLLFGTIRHRISDRPIVVVPSADLHHVLWNALPTAVRHGGVPTTPSLLWWNSGARALRQTAEPNAPSDRVLLVAGPGLEHATRETAELATLFPAADALTGAAATVEAVLAALPKASVAHLACHGAFRADNPWFSTLSLSDGPLHVHEFEGLREVPQFVMLAACSTGRSGVLAGNELLGTSAVLSSMGVATVVAPLVPVADVAAPEIAVGVHRNRLEGREPWQALAALLGEALADGNVAIAAAAASFVCVAGGHGET